MNLSPEELTIAMDIARQVGVDAGDLTEVDIDEAMSARRKAATDHLARFAAEADAADDLKAFLRAYEPQADPPIRFRLCDTPADLPEEVIA